MLDKAIVSQYFTATIVHTQASAVRLRAMERIREMRVNKSLSTTLQLEYKLRTGQKRIRIIVSSGGNQLENNVIFLALTTLYNNTCKFC